MITKFEDYLNESTSEEMFDVVMMGGSIGDRGITSLRQIKGEKVKNPDGLYDTKEKAKDVAKRMNKGLSPGEKKYYGIKYKVATVVDGKYTGK